MRLSGLIARWPRSRLAEGDWVNLRVAQRLADGRVVPAGQSARVIRSMAKGDRTVLIEPVGFGGTPDDLEVAPLGRIEVPRGEVRARWFGWGWTQPSDLP